MVGRAGFLTAAAALLVAWSFVTPVFEGPDEYLHWQYARYVHDHWRLPVVEPSFIDADEPPLYYLAVAPVAWHTPSPPPLARADGRDRISFPLLPRMYLNAGDDLTRYWPIRYARLISVAMSLVTVMACLLAGTEATGRASTGLLAAGFALLLPQFAFRGTHVNNDVLVTAMAAVTTWLLIRMVRRGFTWNLGWLASAAVAATYLSKINGICVAPALALVILTEARPWRARLAHLGVFALTLALVAPWTIRNLLLYGDPFASTAMYHAASAFIQDRTLWTLHHVTTLPRETFKSFVGNFGYLTVKLPKWVHAGYLAFMLFALAGLGPRIAGALRGRDRGLPRILLVLLTMMVGCYAVLVRINMQVDAPQGRFLFPALPALMVLLAIGLEGWRPWSGMPAWPAWATVGGWGVAHAGVLALVVVPAFYPPFVPRLSTVVTDLDLRPARDLQAGPENTGGGRTRTWTITGAQPTLVADVRVAASDALFVLVDIEGRAPTPDRNTPTPDLKTPAPGLKTPIPGLTTPGLSTPGLSTPGLSTPDLSTPDLPTPDLPTPDLIGTFVFSLQDEPSARGDGTNAAARTREVRVPFEWLADGRRRGPRYCLLGDPAWTGTVTGVRLVLADGADERLRGASVILRGLRLAGSPPGHDF